MNIDPSNPRTQLRMFLFLYKVLGDTPRAVLGSFVKETNADLAVLREQILLLLSECTSNDELRTYIASSTGTHVNPTFNYRGYLESALEELATR
jgi:hypothetical protein